jgi:hypothetical protein
MLRRRGASSGARQPCRDYLTPWPAETAQPRYFDRFTKLARG